MSLLHHRQSPEVLPVQCLFRVSKMLSLLQGYVYSAMTENSSSTIVTAEFVLVCFETSCTLFFYLGML